MALANGAENDQPGGKDHAKRNELAGFRFEKIKKVAWLHGCFIGGELKGTGALVPVAKGDCGEGESRFTNTLN